MAPELEAFRSSQLAHHPHRLIETWLQANGSADELERSRQICTQLQQLDPIRKPPVTQILPAIPPRPQPEHS